MPGHAPGQLPARPFIEGDAHLADDAPRPPLVPPGHGSPRTAFRGRPEPHTLSWTVPSGSVALLGGTASGVSGTGSAAVLTLQGELPYADIVIGYDDTHILNDVRITRSGGTTQVASDAASQAAYLTRSFERTDVHTQTDSDSLYTAQGLVGRYKDAHLRIEKLVVKPQRDPGHLLPLVLILDIGDVLTVKRRPQGIGSAISQNVVIEGVSHDVTPETWTVTYQLGPAPVSGWLLGDATYSVLGSTTRLYN